MNKYYEILGIGPGASYQEIKDAYRDLVQVWHPDRFAHDSKLRAKAEGKLKEINEAYEKILSELLHSDDQKLDEHSRQAPHSFDPAPLTTSAGRKKVQPLRPRSWYFGVILTGLFVLALIVITQSVRRRSTQPLAVATSSPIYESSPSPTSTPTSTSTPTPTHAPTAELSRDEIDDLLDKMVAEKQAKQKPTPSIDLSAGIVPEPDLKSISTPTPRPLPRTESLVYASDYLSAGITRSEDTRRYRFRLQQRARVKGSFSARGNINVYIAGGYYSSGGAISADTIDLVLEAGTYELVVSAKEGVGFSVRLSAYYDQ